MKGLASALAVLMAVSVTAHAENLMQDTIYLDEVSVTAQQTQQQNMTSTDYRVQEKKRSNNIADFLERDPEISLKRKTVIGDSGDVMTIRGQSGQRIMLNLDGRTINSTGTNGGNYIDFSTIPLDNIDRIEVIKGGSSAEYGNNALGGVINAYTVRPSASPRVSLYGTLGWLDDEDTFYNVRGSYSQKFGGVGISLGLSHQEADAYLWNNDYSSSHIAPKIYIDTPWQGGELVLGYDYTKTYRGMIRSNRVSADPDNPGYEEEVDDAEVLSLGETFAGGAGGQAMSLVGDGAYYDKIKQFYTATFTQSIGSSAFFELSAFANHEDRFDRNYASKTMGGVQEGALVLDRKVEVDRSYGYKAKTEVQADRHKLVFGAEQKNLRAGAIDVDYVAPGPWKGGIASSDSEPKIIAEGVFLSDSWDITKRLTIDMGLRYDSYDASQYKTKSGVMQRQRYEDDSITPKFGLTYALTPNDKIAVFVYQSYRTPTIPEMNHFSDALGVSLLEDEELKPEKANAIDIAYKHSFAGKKGYVKLSAYHYDIDDYLLMGTNPVTNSGRITYNIENAKFTGVSAEGRYSLTKSLTAGAGLAFTESEKSGDPVSESYSEYASDEVDYVPDLKGNVNLVWKISEKFSLDTTLSYVGEREYFYYGKSRELDPYMLLGTSLSWAANKSTVIEFYVDNIFDTDYEEQYGYPALGLNGGVSVKWTF